MRGTWLLTALVALVIGWCEHLGASLCLLGAWLLYYHRRLGVRIWVHLLVLCFVLWRCTWQSVPGEPFSSYFQIKEIRSSYVIAANAEQRVLLYGMEDVNFDDVYYIRTPFTPIDTVHNFYGFDFATWCHRRGIYWSAQGEDAIRMEAGSSLQHRLYARVQQEEDETIRTIMAAMLFGIQDSDDASYLLTSSGMHISFLLLWQRRLLKRRLSRSALQCVLLGELLLLAYCFTLTPSVLRLLCFQGAALFFAGKSEKDVLGIGVLFTICLAPYMVFEISLLLPLTFRLVYSFHVVKLPKPLISACVLLPLQLYFFQTCNPVQLLLFRIQRACYACAYLVTLLQLCLPFVAISHWLVPFFQLLSQSETIGFSIYGMPPWWWLLGWGWYLLRLLTFRYRRDMVRLAALLGLFFVLPYLQPFAEIYMLDVGQGDCTVIFLPFRQGVYMIDVMGHQTRNIPEDIIVPFLHAKGVSKIDRLLITHQDMDHSGGKEQLQELIEVEEVIETKEQAASAQLPWMRYLLLDHEGADKNDDSIVTYAELGQLRLLFMGDLGITGEQALLMQYPHIKADVLKVGHHGSSTSSSSAFLHTVHPKLSLVSSGRNNRYGHPHEAVVKALRQEGSYMLNTAEKGAVVIKTCKYFTFYKTVEDEFGIITSR